MFDNLLCRSSRFESAIRFANIHLAHYHAFFFQGAPRRDVRVMIQRGHNDFVARLQIASDGSRQREGDGGHVLAETHFVGIAIEKIGHGLPRAGNYGVVATAGGKCTAGIGIVVQQIFLNRVDNLSWHLGARRAIQKSGGCAR